MSKKLYLSYILEKNTPTYGNRNKFIIEKKSSILNGDIANDSNINTTVHIGTHIDMPYHFYEEGQTIEDFVLEYFIFNNVLFLDIEPKGIVIYKEILEELEKIDNRNIDAIIVKTGICHKRGERIFWEQNYGFDPRLANFIRKKFPKVRLLGFDSISVSSFANRMIGRAAHKIFLEPNQPILLLEDMDLKELTQEAKIKWLHVVPLRISKCDGLPCTVIAEIK